MFWIIISYLIVIFFSFIIGGLLMCVLGNNRISEHEKANERLIRYMIEVIKNTKTNMTKEEEKAIRNFLLSYAYHED
jgi:ABC-type uncharacterized transport system permease subunit